MICPCRNSPPGEDQRTNVRPMMSAELSVENSSPAELAFDDEQKLVAKAALLDVVQECCRTAEPGHSFHAWNPPHSFTSWYVHQKASVGKTPANYHSNGETRG